MVVTTVDDVFMRAEPRIAQDSAAYAPLLPAGTELEIMEGPATAGGYVWYRARPTNVTMIEGPGSGWVAVGRPDGLWITPATASISGIELARATVKRGPADPAGAREAAASINAFGVDLYRKVLADGTLDPAKGAVISPASIVLALAMARAGAKDETAAQMDRVLHTAGWDVLAAGLDSLDQLLASRNATFVDEMGTPHELTLRIANAAFGQRGWAIEQGYLDAIAAAFGSGLQLVDFERATEQARQSINAWVSTRTRGRIPELLGPGTVNGLTRLVLVNAIYLKAPWLAEFQEGATQPAPFTRLDGSAADVPTMHRYGGMEIPYARGTGWRATELDLNGGEGTAPLAMTFVLPDDLAAFESRLSAAQIGRITGTLTTERTRLRKVAYTGLSWEETGDLDCGTYPYAVDLYLPRFGVATPSTDVAPSLKALGMSDAFDPKTADLSGVNALEDLFISFVIHQANIDVDEKGVEAAAATAVGVSTTGGCGGPSPLKTITLRFDRPFLFFVRDVETGAILFMGRVVDPTVRS
jgi:serpin B